MNTSDLPRLGLTLGDPAGIGPEVAAKALSDPELRALARIAVFGPTAEQWGARAGTDLGFLSAVHDLATWDGAIEGVDLVTVPDLDLASATPGGPSAASGEASIRFILAAVETVKRGRAEGIVTGPISKEAIQTAGHPWPGHTELLAEAFEADEVAMMFAGGPLRVVLATIHLSLRNAITSLRTPRIVGVVRLADRALKERFGLARPRFGILGLNPHASEAGRFGHEEREIIAPAVEQLEGEGILAFGPLAPDTAFRAALDGQFDCMVAMYHDQGLIPLKTVAFEESVNLTLGLPTVRTSVDHGTAYDIAGRGRADPSSMKQAVRLGAEMVLHGRQ